MKTVELDKEKELIKTLRKNHVVFAAIFGSRAKGIAQPNSDYDILVEFDPRESIPYSRFFRVEEEIKSVLGDNVDFVTVGGLSRFMKDEVLQTMRVLYDNRRK